MKVTSLDIAILIIYFVFCLVIGLYKFHKTDTPRKFALGYSGFSSGMLTCILLASMIGAGTIFGKIEKLYALGIVYLISQLAQPFFWFIMAQIFGKNIDKFSGCISISDIMYKLYGSPGRWISAIVSVIESIGIIAVEALAIGHVFHYFLDIPLAHGIFVSYGILTLYSMLGGVRAVAATEVFQLFIFMFVIPLSLMLTFMYSSDMETLLTNLPLENWGLQPNSQNILLVASFIFYALIPDTRAPIIQRCLMASSSKQLVTSLKTAGYIAMPMTAFICLMGYVVSAMPHDMPVNELLLSYIKNLPTGVKGFMIAGVIAAIMGLAEGWLNASSVIITNDILRSIFPKTSDKMELLAMRMFILLLAVISINVALSSSGIIELIWQVENFSIPIIMTPISAGFLGLKTTYKSFIASAFVAMVCVLFGRLLAHEFGTISLMFGIIGSSVGLFGMHYLQNMDKWQKLASEIFQAKKIDHIKFSIFTLAYCFLYIFQIKGIHSITLVYLLTLAYLLCLTLLVKNIFFSQAFQAKYLKNYWYTTVTFCNPCISTYMLLISNGKDFWLLNSVLSCVSLLFFVNAFEFIIMLTVGIIFGFIIFILTSSNGALEDAVSSIGYGGYIYLFFLLVALVLLRTREKEQKEMLDKTRMFGGAIAHEVRSPIASMMMSLDAVNGVLNEAMATAKKDKDKKYVIKIDERDYQYLLYNSKTLSTTGARAIGTVNHILTSLNTNVITDGAKPLSIKKIVEDAVVLYLECDVHHTYTANKIDVNISKDFIVVCGENYMHHLIMNLIKNAYHHGGADVTVKIWNEGSTLYLEDNGKGIPKSKLSTIFDSFASTSSTGTGIGLSFCKTVVESFGGTIECESELGKYTRFVMRFPD